VIELAEKKIVKNSVVIVTITMVRDQEEYNRMVSTHRSLSQLALTNDWKVVTVNRPTNSTFQKRLEYAFEDFNIEVIKCTEGSVGLQLATAYVEGSKRAQDMVLYTEGDKTDFVPFIGKILAQAADHERIFNTSPAMLVPGRINMGIYSCTRKSPERITNLIQSFLIGTKGDYQYGPKLFDPKIILPHEKIIMDYVKKRPGWQVATWLPIFLAIRYPGQVIPCPINVQPMKGEDKNFFKDLRFRFLTQLRQAIVAMWDAAQ